MKLRQTLCVVAFGFGSLAFMASGAAADWLVTSDGSKVEIEGPYEVKGKLVVFTLPGGTLGSMPASAVDLESSRALNEQASAKQKPVEEAPKAKAAMVLTDADVGHPNLAVSDSLDEGEPPGADSVPVAVALQVTGWQESVDLSRNSISINGTLRNPTENPATSIELGVELFDEEGELLERSTARLERGFLNPGNTTRFEAIFNDTLSYSSVEFDIRSRGFMSAPPADEPSPDDPDADLDEDEFEDDFEDDSQDVQ